MASTPSALGSFPGQSAPGVPKDKRKLRSACDSCHQAKVKCSGGVICARCASQGLSCHYGYQNRTGKPKGSKNKKTIERLRDMAMKSGSTFFEQPSPRHSPVESLVKQPGPGLSLHELSVGGGDSLTNDMYDFTSLPTPNISSPPLMINGSEGFEAPGEHEPMDFSFAHGAHRDSSFDDWTIGDDVEKGLPEGHDCRDGQITPSSLPSGEDELGITNGTEASCFCISNHYANLAALHQLSLGKASSQRPIDIVMKSISEAISACTQFLHCTRCSKSYPSILLSLSTLHIVFEMFEQLVANNIPGDSDSDEHHSVIFRLGTYEISKEESIAVRQILLKMTLQKGGLALSALRRRLAGLQGPDADYEKSRDGIKSPLGELIVPSSSPQNTSGDSSTESCRPGSDSTSLSNQSLPTLDREYIQQYINRKEAVLELLTRMLMHQGS